MRLFCTYTVSLNKTSRSPTIRGSSPPFSTEAGSSQRRAPEGVDWLWDGGCTYSQPSYAVKVVTSVALRGESTSSCLYSHSRALALALHSGCYYYGTSGQTVGRSCALGLTCCPSLVISSRHLLAPFHYLTHCHSLWICKNLDSCWQVARERRQASRRRAGLLPSLVLSRITPPPQVSFSSVVQEANGENVASPGSVVETHYIMF